MDVRFPAVTGLFYPDSAQEIQDFIKGCYSQITVRDESKDKAPRALIVPHAGYVYSGCSALQGYQYWQNTDTEIKTVVVIGPAHRVAFNGVATVSVDALQTPLGLVEVDCPLRDELIDRGLIGFSDEANAPEHSLEVQFPFIQSIVPGAKIVPLLSGRVDSAKLSQIMEYLWSKKGVYFVISSDLSHFHTYEEAQRIDQQTADFINNVKWQSLNGERACGYIGIQALLRLQSKLGLNIEQLNLINSGDTAGDKQRVVGYGAWAIYDGLA
ncbi:MEMO1 family protein [Thiomicrorhabdus immobilis]|uniref:MEMO1 family protein n=1 Tax=Thiomicrorhabdus immobilis TaxID=2791037 RepID=A0ABN6CVR4_9GAMM|nr:AmmeMemoRadiSam system protein B [Thiomicrorhabdus immobilis]BCN93121.1 MEMO1 family protein [Thiomicrorhabdus immobilis]